MYTQAAICKNGHVATANASSYTDSFCKECGSEIIKLCPNCGASIQGYYYEETVWTCGCYNPPSYCHNCGHPYPWTTARIEAAKMLIEDMDKLSDEEKKKMSESIDKIISDTPYTEAASNRIKKYLLKAGKESASAFRDLLVNIASEAAKKILGL